jgi:hypothetical protein
MGPVAATVPQRQSRPILTITKIRDIVCKVGRTYAKMWTIQREVCAEM